VRMDQMSLHKLLLTSMFCEPEYCLRCLQYRALHFNSKVSSFTAHFLVAHRAGYFQNSWFFHISFFHIA